MKTSQLRPRLNRLTGPASQPVSVADAKRQLNIAPSDTVHDEQLTEAIEAAREQFEKDAPIVTVAQQFEMLLEGFGDERELRFPVRPVNSIDLVTYRDGSSDPTALDGAVYRLSRDRRRVILNHGQCWPTFEPQPEAVTITFTAGFAAGACPKLVKQAILLMVAKWFEDRDMMFGESEDRFAVAYKNILLRLKRSTYP